MALKKHTREDLELKFRNVLIKKKAIIFDITLLNQLDRTKPVKGTRS
jgi:hypothetical protein